MNQNGTKVFAASFTGNMYDAEAGMYYFNARWYDSEIGRFITEDPARDGVNWFVYCRNNPVKFVDRTGKEIEAVFEVNKYIQTDYGWMAYGILTLVDNEKNQSIMIDAYSGGKGRASDGVSLPLPLGEYDILDRNKTGFFRLEAKDEDYGNDKVDGIETEQSNIRMHYDGATYGCLSLKAEKNKEFPIIEKFIKSTRTTEVKTDYIGKNPFKSKEKLTKYGTLKVIQSKEIMIKDMYVSEQYKQKYEHQRMKK